MSYTVYKHTNKVNGKIYIGVTSTDPVQRWANGHGYRFQKRFFNDIILYGWLNFDHDILYKELEREDALRIESELIKEYATTNPKYGYNVSTYGGNTTGRSIKPARLKVSKVQQSHGEKSITIEKDGKVQSFESIKDCCDVMGWKVKTFWARTNKTKYKGWKIKVTFKK